MADIWKVFRCLACNNCHGRKSIGHPCPHCGLRITESSPVVDKASNASELRSKVAMANTPPELRDKLSQILEKSDRIVASSDLFSPSKCLQVLKDSEEGGILQLKTVQENFESQGLEVDVQSFIEMVESQGLIVRLEDGIWQFLE